MKKMAMDSPSPMEATVMKVLRLLRHTDRQASGKITVFLLRNRMILRSGQT
jgi:hypothetical protein